jgi:hypothetical protein
VGCETSRLQRSVERRLTDGGEAVNFYWLVFASVIIRIPQPVKWSDAELRRAWREVLVA